MAKKILITGAGGYIGSVATHTFLEKGYEVVAVDNFVTGFRAPIETLQKKYGAEKLHLVETDLQSDLNPLFEKEKDIAAVIHYAASCSVNESMEHPEKYFTNNVAATQNLLSTMMKHGVKTIVFSSTCATYGDAKEIPITEDHPTNPANPYGESKRMIEKMMEWYGKQSGLQYVILRYFNVCGATDDGTIGDAKKPSVHLMQNCVRGALGIEPFLLTCSEMDTPDKTPIRDYVNVVDLNNAHVAAVEHLLNNGSNEIINIGTGTGNSVLEIVNKVSEITGTPFNLEKTSSRQGESPKLIASIERAKNILHWEPKHTLDDSVNSLVAWYKNHPHGWDS